MLELFFILFVGLEIKHCIADYFLQPAWMLVGKGDLRHPGGYAHAGVHAGLSAIVLLVAGTPLPVLLALVAAEASSTTCSTSPRSTIRGASMSMAARAASGPCTGSTSSPTS
jgi:hypothetical protein